MDRKSLLIVFGTLAVIVGLGVGGWIIGGTGGGVMMAAAGICLLIWICLALDIGFAMSRDI